jgi:hypothetical protein
MNNNEIIQGFYDKINNVQKQAIVAGFKQPEHAKKEGPTFNERLFYNCIERVVKEAMRKVPQVESKADMYLRSEYMTKVATILERVIKKNCEIIIEICSKSDYTKRKIEKVYKEIEEEEIKLRKKIAEKLISARKRLKKLKYQVAEKQAELKKAEIRLNSIYKSISVHEICAASNTSSLEYPPVPEPLIKPHPYAHGIPEESGIYFIWSSGGELKYIGQSVNLSLRLRLGNHNKLRSDDLISFVLIPKELLLYAECFYIGVMKPTSNGGTPSRGPRVEI